MPQIRTNKEVKGKTADDLRRLGWKPYLQVFDADGVTCELVSYPYPSETAGPIGIPMVQVRLMVGEPGTATERPCEDFWTVLKDPDVARRRMEIIANRDVLIRGVWFTGGNEQVAVGFVGVDRWMAVRPTKPVQSAREKPVPDGDWMIRAVEIGTLSQQDKQGVKSALDDMDEANSVSEQAQRDHFDQHVDEGHDGIFG